MGYCTGRSPSDLKRRNEPLSPFPWPSGKRIQRAFYTRALDLLQLQRFSDVLAAKSVETRNHSLGHGKGEHASYIGWPFPATNLQHRLNLPAEFDLQSPPVLVVSSLYDYNPPYSNAVKLHGQLPGSVLLTTRKKGHCSYTPHECQALRMMKEYLISGRLPAPNTIADS